LTDDQILEKLLVLNLERATEEQKASVGKEPIALRERYADEMLYRAGSCFIHATLNAQLARHNQHCSLSDFTVSGHELCYARTPKIAIYSSL
jgi:hypothetical protein